MIDRAITRALVDAGYMQLAKYVSLYGESQSADVPPDGLTVARSDDDASVVAPADDCEAPASPFYSRLARGFARAWWLLKPRALLD